MSNQSPPGDGCSSDESARPNLSLAPCGQNGDDDTDLEDCKPCEREERERALEASVRRHPANRIRAVPTPVDDTDGDSDDEGNVDGEAEDDRDAADQAEAERLADVIPLSDAYRPGEPF